nr:hypothetical protein [uncultured Rhodopila sp.]
MTSSGIWTASRFGSTSKIANTLFEGIKSLAHATKAKGAELTVNPEPQGQGLFGDGKSDLN